MADTVEITPGTGAVIGTDEVTIGGTLQQVQRVKLVDGTDGGTDLLPGSAGRGLAVEPRARKVRLSVTPTISTSAYTAKDNVGGLMTFTGAARTSGGSCRIDAVQVVDQDREMADLDLVLFDRTITVPTDNAIFDPTDAELAYCVGWVPITGGHYADFNDNAVASVHPVGIETVLNGTDLFGVLVARESITYTSTADLTVILTILQD